MGFWSTNKYDLFMRRLRLFIRGTGLGKRGVHGCTPETIKQMEIEIGEPIPLALKTWYLYFGNKPPAWYDHDADYSVQDFYRTQRVAQDLLAYEAFQWEHKENILAFSSRLGEQLMFLDLNGEEDPPVYHYMEQHIAPTPMSIAFSAYIRAVVIDWFEGPIFQKEYFRIVQGGQAWPELETWQERRKSFHDLYEEARLIRKQLTETIHQKDQKRGFLTPPMSFQKQWIAEFSKSATWIKFQEAGLRMPYSWICPPRLKKSS
ncbi:MAG: hypothetical protein DPW16_17445 [Chloroflexi bacterium]|nr:hypothetical protein [Chloroflexota bacterium]